MLPDGLTLHHHGSGWVPKLCAMPVVYWRSLQPIFAGIVAGGGWGGTCMHAYSSLQSLCLALQRNLRHCLLPELTSSLPLQSGRIQWEKVSPAAGKREGCVCRRKRSLLLPSNCERKLANQMERAQTALLLHRFLPRPTQHTHTYAHTLAFGRFIPKPDPQTA